MTKTLIVNEEDICKMLAEKFKCDPKNVTLLANREIRGYGLGEYEETTISAKLVKVVNDSEF